MGGNFMTGVLTMNDISFDEKPKMELVYDTIAHGSCQVSGICNEFIIDVNQFYIFNKESRLNPTFELSENQNFFMKLAISKLTNTIALERNYLRNERIEQPTEKVIEEATQLIRKLARKGIFPDNISTSVEEGICLSFKNGDETMYFEMYNDGESGYIVENNKNKSIVANEDISSPIDSINAVEVFINKYEIPQLFSE